MSPRPPPKIFLKHEWKRELGSEHAQQSEVGQLPRSFQSNQPTLNPIRERKGRTVITHDVIGVQDGRNTSRSQEIDVNSFREEPGSSERTGRPVTGRPVNETSVIQARSSNQLILKNVLLMKAKRSTLLIMKRDFVSQMTVRPVIDHDVWTSKFQDCHILL